MVAYAQTENADTTVKEQFYTDLEVVIAQCGRNDLKVILGDFNAVTGSSRIQGDTASGFRTMGTHRRRLITYFHLVANWFNSAEFITVSTLTMTIFLCWQL